MLLFATEGVFWYAKTWKKTPSVSHCVSQTPTACVELYTARPVEDLTHCVGRAGHLMKGAIDGFSVGMFRRYTIRFCGFCLVDIVFCGLCMGWLLLSRCFYSCPLLLSLLLLLRFLLLPFRVQKSKKMHCQDSLQFASNLLGPNKSRPKPTALTFRVLQKSMNHEPVPLNRQL